MSTNSSSYIDFTEFGGIFPQGIVKPFVEFDAGVCDDLGFGVAGVDSRIDAL